jgi:hypothetical protein
MSKISYRDKAPNNALLAEAIRSCSTQGIKYLVYDNYAYGKKEQDTLIDFKERNGFQRVNVPRYYVPLTPLGHAALRMGLQRRLVERVPEPLAKRLRDFRKYWLSRSVASAGEAA